VPRQQRIDFRRRNPRMNSRARSTDELTRVCRLILLENAVVEIALVEIDLRKFRSIGAFHVPQNLLTIDDVLWWKSA
jgi:hypothetical protein